MPWPAAALDTQAGERSSRRHPDNSERRPRVAAPQEDAVWMPPQFCQDIPPPSGLQQSVSRALGTTAARSILEHWRAKMASIRKEIQTSASPEKAWAALRDVGALHTRLVPGFVVDTRLEHGERVVTFGNGMVVREPIIDISDEWRRVAWAAIGGPLTHYNGSAQVLVDANNRTRIVWIADFLPNDAAEQINLVMEQGMAVMKATLDKVGDQ